MKVLQINAVNDILSTGRTTKELADELQLQGHESYIAYAIGYKPAPNTYKIGNQFDRKIHALLSRITGLQGYFSIISTLKLIYYVKQLQPEIVHLRNLHSNYINLKMFLKYLSKNDIATVITLHDCWFYTGRCTHYTWNHCYQWQSICNKCPNNNNTMPSWFFDRAKKMWIDKKRNFQKINRLAVIGVSDWITNEAKKSFLSQAKIVQRIYNWIDLNVFKPTNAYNLRKKYNIVDKFIILGVAASWEEGKGIRYFTELSKQIKEDTIIVLVGNQNPKYQLIHNIITIPQTSSKEELACLYSMSDVLLQLSREESFGKVVAESLACGTPVIVRNTTASPELVGNGCGYVLQTPYKQKELLRKIDEVKKNKKETYTHHCRQFALSHFEKRQCVNAYITVYKSLLESL